jgi:PKHD-type hydroxylase
VSYPVTEHLTAQLNVQNLTDELYYTSIRNNVNATSGAITGGGPRRARRARRCSACSTASERRANGRDADRHSPRARRGGVASCARASTPASGSTATSPRAAGGAGQAQRAAAEAPPAAREGGASVLDALGRSPLFIAAALPLKIFPPLFNRYGAAQAFGTHVDNAVRIQRGSEFRVRSDLSATLFLDDPTPTRAASCWIEGQFGAQAVKLPAGDMVLYPVVEPAPGDPVTGGTRVASFFWIQSMVRDDARGARCSSSTRRCSGSPANSGRTTAR